MDVLDLVGLERVGLAEGRKERFFRDALERLLTFLNRLDYISVRDNGQSPTAARN